VSDDFDDLLAPPPPEPTVKKTGRPSNTARAERAAASMAEATLKNEIRLAGVGKTKIPLDDFKMPCSQQFLADVWNMDAATVRKRLMGRGLEMGTAGGGRPVYNFQEASKYLIKPKMDIATYLKTLNPGDMPNSINKVFWEAERIKKLTE